MTIDNKFISEVLDTSYVSPTPYTLVCRQHHQLTPFISSEVVQCDICSLTFTTHQKMYGCRECNYGICESCEKINSMCKGEIQLPVDISYFYLRKIHKSIDRYYRFYGDNTNYDLGD